MDKHYRILRTVDECPRELPEVVAYFTDLNKSVIYCDNHNRVWKDIFKYHIEVVNIYD